MESLGNEKDILDLVLFWEQLLACTCLETRLLGGSTIFWAGALDLEGVGDYVYSIVVV